MLLDLISSVDPKTLIWIRLEEPLDEVLCLRCNHTLFITYIRPFEPKVEDIVEHSFNALRTKRFLTNKNFIDNNTKAPPINSRILRTDLSDDFRRYIIWSSNDMATYSARLRLPKQILLI